MKRSANMLALAAAVGCSLTPGPHGELPSFAVTRWTDRTELFMEHDAMVAGQETLFAVHLTDLDTFEPISQGAPVLDLENEQLGRLQFDAPAPSRPGIYRIVATVPEPGRYHMVLRVLAPEDVHDLGEVTVHTDVEGATQAQEPDEPTEPIISFLKEQQWGTGFRTETVRERTLRTSARVPAAVEARAGGEAWVIAPVAGRLLPDDTFPAPGSRLIKGQGLARLAPRASQPEDRPSLEFLLVEAKEELSQARRERERAERLLEAKAIPGRQLEQARQRETVAIARRDAARKKLERFEETRRLGGSGAEETVVSLSSPLSGVLVESRATPGSTVEQGDALFLVLDPHTVYVVGAVPENVAPRLRAPVAAEIEIPGQVRPFPIDSQRGRLMSFGAAVDTATRTVPLIYEVDNSDNAFLVGQAVSLVLFTEETSSTLAVPETALVHEGSQSVVFVQVGGESFVRRAVETGARDQGYVQVLRGLSSGERVVTEGAYEIRLATLSGQVPAEGHVH